MDHQTLLEASEYAYAFWIEAKKRSVEEQIRYHFYAIYHYSQHLCLSRLKRALQEVVDRHYHLRSHFFYDEAKGCLMQAIQKEGLANIIFYRVFSEEASEIHEQEEIERPFDLEKGPLHRFVIIENEWSKKISLIVNIHHSVLDGTQYDSLMKEIEHYYNFPSFESEKDEKAVDALRTYLEEERRESSSWPVELASAEIENSTFSWSIEKNEIAKAEVKIGRADTVIEGRLYQAVKDFSRKTNHSVFNILKMAFAVLISKYCYQEQVLLSYPINQRSEKHPFLKGCFVNFVYWNHIIGEESFLDLLEKDQKRREAFKKAKGFSVTPKMISKKNPLPPHTFSISKISTRYNGPQLEEGFIQESIAYPLGNSDVILYLDDNEEDIFLQFCFHKEVIHFMEVNEWFHYFRQCLWGLIEHAESESARSICMLDAKEYFKLVHAWNYTKKKYSDRITLYEWIEHQVEKTPHHVAVIFDNQSITYFELNQKANQLASFLQRQYGSIVKKNKWIPLCVERGLHMLFGILGILKMGGAYVPLNPELPKERLQYLLKDLNADFLLSQSYLAMDEKIEKMIPVISLNEIPYEKEQGGNLSHREGANALAAIIYTSGTTGAPKGVMLSHRGFVNRIEWMQNQYGLSPQDKILQKTPYFFDVSIWEFFWPLMYGGTIVFCKPKEHRENSSIDSLIRKENITKIHFVPSMFSTYLEYLTFNEKPWPPSLKQVFCSGEALNEKEVRTFHDIQKRDGTKAALYNLYGPTEASIDVSSFECNVPLPRIPIGKPIQNMKWYLLDKGLCPVPVGGIGEIYISGVGLGKGYLNQPRLVSEKFIDSPFDEREILYKTGDLGKYLPDGNMDYLGRNDSQVKINGIRIELQEIESQLSQYSLIQKSVVLLKNKQHSKGVFPYLVAYYVSVSPLEEKEIEEYLKRRLPDYMVPKRYIFMNEFPLSPNGKLDKSLLPEPVFSSCQTLPEKPENKTEETLFSILKEVFELDTLSREDSFFSLGGDSLIAIRIVSRLSKEGYDLRVQDIFEEKTLKNFAKKITILQKEKEEKDDPFSWVDNNTLEEIMKKIPRVEDIYPVSQLQMGMLLESQKSLDGTYHDVFCYEIRREMKKELFLKIWDHLIDRHSLLRTSFQSDAQWGYLAIQHRTLSREEINKKILFLKPSSLEKLIEKERINSFPLEEPGLFRLLVFCETEQSFSLVFSFHHAMADGWSVALLITEFLNQYTEVSFTHEISNNKLPPYGKFARREIKNLNNEIYRDFWKQYLLNAKTEQRSFLLSKSSVSEKPLIQKNHILSQEVSRNLMKLSKELNVSVDAVLMAAFQLVAHVFYGKKEIFLGIVTHNRLVEEMSESMVGVFLNTIPFKSVIQYDNSSLLIQSVFKEKMKLESYKQYPYGKMKKDLMLESDLYQCAFNYIHFQGLDNYEEKGLFHYSAGFGYSAGFEKTNIPFLFNGMKIKDQLYLQMNTHPTFMDESMLDRWMNYLIHYLHEFLKKDLSINPLTQEDIDQINQLNHHSCRPLQQSSQGKLLHQLFEIQVSKTPKAIALVAENVSFTYEELNQKSNQVAHYIRSYYIRQKNQELEKDTIIAFCVKRNSFLIIGILGILKAGAAYLPLENNLSFERLSHILKETKTPFILTEEDFKSQFETIKDTPFIFMEEALSTMGKITLPFRNEDPSQLAYVMYTSGTTGMPKGVMVQHDGVVNTLTSLNKVYVFENGKNRVGFFSAYVFDVSVSEIFSTLSKGGELYLISDVCRQDPNALSQFILKHELNYIYLPPFVLNVLPRIPYPSLKGIIFAGEPCDSSVGAYWAKQCNLYNYYGPTETSIYVTGGKVQSESIQEIGKPLENMKAYVLNDEKKLMPVGASGRLYVSGIGVSRGYLKDIHLTEQKFQWITLQGITSRYYDTGDRVRLLPHGSLEYLGREDQQVKIRGVRIELLHIEHALSSLNLLEQYCVFIHGEGAEKEIVCCVVTRDKTLQEMELVQLLKNQLPSQMLPSRWTFLDTLPMTIHGKIDKQSLKKNLFKKDSFKEKVSENSLENLIVKSWEKVLQKNNLPMEEAFFQLGGDSMKILQLKNELEKSLKKEISVVDLFKYPTLKEQCDFLCAHYENVSKKRTLEEKHASHEIAIIAMSGAFSGVSSLEEYWDSLLKGKENLTFFESSECYHHGVSSHRYQQENYVSSTGYIPGTMEFDPSFWGLSFKEASRLDPQIRKFLEHCWYVLEDSGYVVSREKENIALFCGASHNSYIEEEETDPTMDEDYETWEKNSLKASQFLATRVSYLLGLTGMAMNINTACSTSLIAIIQACESLSLNKCDLALAGAVSLMFPKDHGHLYQEGMIFSKDGHCRPFDENASGIVNGSGVGVLLLKRWEDAKRDGDPVIAIIKGYAANNDGHRKVGYTAPSVIGQGECILSAQHHSNLKASEIHYIECHGTGTHLGDPIELRAISEAFEKNKSSQKKGHCFLGSVKANIGHADSAAGMAGILKVCKMLEHRMLPPQINFKHLNKNISLHEQQFEISTEAKSWDPEITPLRMGVSSFGIGGTNAHLILEEPVDFKTKETPEEKGTYYLFPLSAKNETVLRRYEQSMLRFFKTHKKPSLKNISNTLQTQRIHFDCRNIFVANTREACIEALSHLSNPHQKKKEEERPIIFLFPGQGAQYVGMGEFLYEQESVFREVISHCFSILREVLSIDFHSLFLGKEEKEEKFKNTKYLQPLLFSIEYALAVTIQSYGIFPVTALGHSLGEYVAATLSGVFSLEDALHLVGLRGEYMSQMEEGGMLFVKASSHFLHSCLEEPLELAAVNGKSSCVIAGPHEALQIFKRNMEAQQISTQLLETSHGFHSKTMGRAATLLKAAMEKKSLHIPKWPFISSVTGGFIKDEEAISPHYWAEQITKPVEFFKALQTAFSHYEKAIYLELGPGATLASFLQQSKENMSLEIFQTMASKKQYSYFCREGKKDILFQNTLAALWKKGHAIHWPQPEGNKKHFLVKLPSYSFETQECSILSKEKIISQSAVTLYEPVWEKIKIPPLKRILSSQWIIFMDEEESLIPLRDLLLKNKKQVMCIYENTFKPHDSLSADVIIYGWSLSKRNQHTLKPFFDLIKLQRNQLQTFQHPTKLILLTTGMALIKKGEEVIPEQGSLMSILHVFPHEMPWIHTLCIDISLKEKASFDSLLNFFETEASFSNESLYAWRRGRLFKQEIKPFIKKQSEGTLINNKDVIFISGGLGGMASAVMLEISKHHKVTFILLARKKEKMKFFEPIMKILHERGSQVDIQWGDITCEITIQNLMIHIENKYGTIQGIIHAAGLPPLGLQEKTDLEMLQVIMPKLQGAYHLLEATKKHEIRYFVLCASLTTHLGMVGTVEYGAANGCLNVLSQSYEYPHVKQFLCIDWLRWSGAGMASELKKHSNPMVAWNEISHEEGGKLFYDLLCHASPTQLLISRYHPDVLRKALFYFPLQSLHEKKDASSTEAVAQVFKEVLGMGSIKEEESFFDVGGSSLSAVQLVARLKKIGIHMSLSQLLTHSTISSIAGFNTKRIHQSCIVPLKINSQEASSVFFIHPVGGTLMMYRELVQQLTSQYNYYGIQNPWIDGNGDESPSSLNALATYYLKEIKKMNHKGPYIFMGASLGGTLAYEMASQLLAHHQSVSWIALFDSWAFFSEKQRSPLLFKEYMKNQMQKELLIFKAHLKEVEDEYITHQLITARWKLMELLIHYKAQSFFGKKGSFKVHLFKANELDEFHEEFKGIRDNGWEVLLGNRLNTYNIEGDHISLMQSPGVHTIGKLLNELLLNPQERKEVSFEYQEGGYE